MAAEQPAADTAEKSASKGRLVPALMVLALMGVEGVGVFFIAKAINPEPVPTLGAVPDGDGEGGAKSDEDEFGEVELAECRPSNKVSGKFITFHIRVSALVESSEVERVQKIVRARKARVEDAINTVIRSAEPKHLSEPRFETIKRRLKLEMDRILGDDQIVKEILIPQMLQSGGGV